jgi:8-oxo-dGTP diphosphatase
MKIVSKAIIHKSDRYLLQLRDNKLEIVYPNCWSFFGGELNNNETTWQGLKRELNEEIGWIPTHGTYTHCSINNKMKCNIHYYLIGFNYYETKLVLNEGQALDWFSLNEITNLNAPFVYNTIVKSKKLIG